MPPLHLHHATAVLARWLTPRCGPLTLLLIGLLISPLGVAAGYTAQAGKLYDGNGQEVQVRGISHFGFNAEILQPQYLWQMGWKEQIAQIKALGFNSVRVPFVPDTLYSNQTVDQLSYLDPNLNADLMGKTPLQVLDLWMAEADRQGLYIMLDFHSVLRQRLYPTWFVDNPADVSLTYNGQPYTEDHWVRDLQFVAARYAHLAHFFAVDLYNEPYGVVRWSVGDPNATDPKNHWKPAAEKAAAAVLQSNPNLLIFVQGISANFDGIEDSNLPINYGENFQPHAYQPLQIPADKLVLSPHTYGPDVFVKESFSAPNFPANLVADWEKLFGQFSNAHPIVIGEWGGRFGQGGVGAQDVVWQNALVDYLLSKNIRSSFYWCYTPNSGDTGGILDNDLNVRQDKMALLQRHWGAAPSGTPTLPPIPTPVPTPAPTPTPNPDPGPDPVPSEPIAPSEPVPSLPSSSPGADQSGGGGAFGSVFVLLFMSLLARFGAALKASPVFTPVARHGASRRSSPALRLLLAALFGLFASPLALAAGYHTQGGKIYDAANQEVQVRGVSHFGFNAEILQPQFLWSMGWKEQIAQIKALGFNAVRVPFVPDTLYVNTPVNQLSYVDANKNPELIGKTPLQALDLWMAEANRQGLYVMLDFHSVTKYRLYPTWFIDSPADYWLTHNGQPYTADNWVRDLKFVAARYAHLPYFFAIDIYNEPNGVVRWSTGDPNSSNPKNHWKPAAEKAAAGVLQSNPNLLIFVQGINGNYDGIEDSNIPMNWGESFQQQAYQPLNIANDKLVLSPHTYGPDVFVKSSFSAPSFPANLVADWEKLFGRFATQHPIVIGEWGGRFGQGGVGTQDVVWQNALVDYLLSKNIRNSFYWCYTPNSGDTGGILDDNLNVRQDKMALLQRHWGGATSSPATLALTASSYAVAQNAGAVTITVKRSGSSSGAASVNYATSNGTATAGTHYSAASGTLNWAAGNTADKSFTVAVSNSAPFTGSKSFTVALSNAGSGAVVGSPASASVSINGSAVVAPGSLALSASSYTVAQNAGSLTVSISRSGGSGGAVSVQYSTADGSARAGTDYTARSGTLSWGGGDTSTRSFSVPVSNAAPFSGSRSFTVRLSNGSGGVAVGTPSTATASITGSAVATTPATLALAASNYSVAQSTGTVSLKIKRSGSATAAVSLRYATANGSAVSGRDYTARSGKLNWAKGDSADKVVTVAISKATPFTGIRSFTLRLSAPAGGAALGTPNTATVAITGSAVPTTPVLKQPYVQNFSPASGPVGTVVTVNGSSFTGANLAWVGAAHNGMVSVISDTQLKVTIPPGATSGAIGIFNPSFVAFTATSFTVTTTATTVPVYTQPYIQNFSPASGPVGTVVTVNGSGFTGANLAWVGAAHNGMVNVISDTQLRVTIPAGATTGAIGIFSPAYVAFTATSFTVVK